MFGFGGNKDKDVRLTEKQTGTGMRCCFQRYLWMINS